MIHETQNPNTSMTCITGMIKGPVQYIPSVWPNEPKKVQTLEEQCPIEKIHSTTDARFWARHYWNSLKENPKIAFDEEHAFTWFANAIEAAKDITKNKISQEEKYIYVLITRTGSLVSVYSSLPCQSLTDRDYSLFLNKDLKCIPNTDIPLEGQGSNWNCDLFKVKVDSLNRVMVREKIEYKQ